VDIMMVARVREHYQLKPRYERLRERGFLTLEEVARALGISTATAKQWRLAGLLPHTPYNDKNQYLYERPGLMHRRAMLGKASRAGNVSADLSHIQRVDAPEARAVPPLGVRHERKGLRHGPPRYAVPPQPDLRRADASAEHLHSPAADHGVHTVESGIWCRRRHPHDVHV
jgi:hypothetical protein